MSSEARAESPNSPETAGPTDELISKKTTRRRFIQGAGVAAATAASAGPATAQSTRDKAWTEGRSGLDFSSDFVPNAYNEEDGLTRAKHRMKWGATLEALEFYEDDSGNKARLPGYVPTKSSTPEHDTDNVVTVRADKFDFPDGYNFPRGETYDGDGDGESDEDVYALDATHWSTTDASTGTVSVTDADLDVSKALNVASSSLADGETVSATFTDVSVSDDVEKSYFQGVINVNSVGSNALVKIALRDDDGDEKILTVDPSGDASTAKVITTGAGNGIVFQQRIGDLATDGSGDGTFDSIEEVEIRISASGGASDADVTLTAFNAEKPAKWVFGSYLKNEGTDSEERVKRERPGPGTFTMTSLDTMSDELKDDSAVIYDVEQPMRYTMQESDHPFEFRFLEASDYPGYDYRLQIRGKQSVPTGYDLTHTALSWFDQVTAPASRYVEVWTATGTEDVDFADIDDTSKTAHAGNYDSRGAEVTLKSSASAGNVNTFFADILLTSSNKSDAESSGGGGGGAPPSAKGGNGILSVIAAIFGGLGITGLLARLSG
ncbi:twin-arginine translocation signal domain-containing protein [Halobellus limi]|uniref:Tat (Twin-arginine translocation) pathway signal sequence n=1 Tax=Halobellus limi TaxID=699433 RepID=A0A1H5SP02_9EURY|nr:twin-arginine translocation signal domain-containing protein [Halobellus limi]QCC47529.1 hypothetical protein DV707_07560 [Halobellus limi]SEF52333.1 Tat (twin-arginine translocation) pathway signal sequence [Halobellus limi]